jgi:branched-chain amino acid transport system substrate-binding protein
MRRAVVCGLVACVLIAGCGSDDSESSPGTDASAVTDPPEVTAAPTTDVTSSTPASVDTTTGTNGSSPEPAAGEPLLIGVTAPANSPIFDASEMLETVAVAADYVNNELGGIAGRPIELVSCETDNSPESVLSCASDLIGAAPVLVIHGPDYAGAAATETYAAADMPLIGGAAFIPQEFTAPNRVLFQGWSASLFPGMAYFAATELDAENIVAIGFDDPQNQAILAAFMNPVMQRLGLPDLQYVGTPPTSPDFTTTLATAVSADPDAILAFGLPCEPIVQAYRATGTDIPLVLPDNCTDPSMLSALGDAAEGVYFVGQLDSPTLSPDDPETQTYQQAVDAYGDGDVRETSIGLAGFASVLNIHDVLDSYDPDAITSEAVLAEFQAIEAGPNSLIDGDFNCATPPLPAFSALCNVSAWFATVQDGQLTQIGDWADAKALWG